MNFNCIYLHGFASSTDSFKALFFKEKLKEEFNINLKIPDLNTPNFTEMLVSNQIKQIHTLLSQSDINVLIGSSLGAYLAVLIAELYPKLLKSIILIAPAINMASFTLSNMNKDYLEAWKKSGLTQIDMAYSSEKKLLRYDFIEDLLKFEKDSYDFNTNCIVFHGLNDDKVPINIVESVFINKQNCTLFKYQSDHLMHDKLDEIWVNIRNEFIE